MKRHLLNVLTITALLIIPSFSHAFTQDDLKTADGYYAEHSYQMAMGEYYKMLNDPSGVRGDLYREAQFKWADCVVKAQDREHAEEALKNLKELIESKDHDQWWAEANQTIAETMIKERPYDKRDQVIGYLMDAKDYWAGSTDVELARTKHTRINFSLADFLTYNFGWQYNDLKVLGKASSLTPEIVQSKPGIVIKTIYEEILKIAKSDEDKARAHYNLAMSVSQSYYGEIKDKDEAVQHFNVVIKDFSKSEWADDAYYQLGMYYNNRSDFVKSLEIYQQLLKTFKVGESQWLDEAKRMVEAITKPTIQTYISNTFVPGSEIQFNLNWRNIKEATLKFYKIDLTKELSLNLAKKEEERGYDNYQQLLKYLVEESGRVQLYPTELSFNVQLKDEGKHIQYSENKGLAEWRKSEDEKEVDIKKGILPAGAYLLLATAAGGARSYELVLVSTMGVVSKMAADTALFFTFDASTGKPMANSKVKYHYRYYNEQSHWVWDEGEGTTDAQGLFKAAIKNPKNNNSYTQHQMFATVVNDSQQAMVQNSYYDYRQNNKGQWWLYAFSDRPAYRPNEVVSFKGILRQNDGALLTTPSAMPVKIRIYDAQNNLVKEGNYTLNDYGAFNDTLTLSDKAVLGQYRIDVRSGDNNNQLASVPIFRLEEYKLPEFEVKIKPQSKADSKQASSFRVGEPVTVDVDAQYYFGGPVGNAQVEYLVYQNPLYSNYRPMRQYPWYYEDMYQRNYGYGYGTLLKQEKIKTDAKGKASFAFDTPKDVNNDWQYHVEVRVVDQSRREIHATADIKVTRNAFFAYLEPKQNLYRPGDKAQVTIKTMTANEEPMVVDGKVSVLRNWWKDPIPMRADKATLNGQETVMQPGRYDGQEIFSKFVKTNEQGEAVFEFEPHEDGYYVVQFTGFDNGKEVKSETTVFVCTTSSKQIGYKYGGLQIIAEKDTYAQGDTARLMIVADKPDTWVLFTAEAQNIYDVQMLHLEGSVKLIEVPVTENFVPNVFFNALSAGHYQMKLNNIQIIVPPVEKFLNVKITSDKTTYTPQEEGRFDILVTDKEGRPVSAELSLGITDAAVYYIQDELVPDIRQFFYGNKRPMAVTTQASMYNRPYLNLVRGLKNELITDQEKDRRLSNGKAAVGSVEGYGGERQGGDEFKRVRREVMVSESLSKATAVDSLQEIASPIVSRKKEKGEKQLQAKDNAKPMDATSEPLAEAQLRSDFRSTVIWQPSIVTDAEGKATVKVKFPDSLTTWRSTARAITPETQIGSITHEVKSKKDLMIRLQAPRFFTERDLVAVSALIDNMTDDVITVMPSLKIEGGMNVTGLYVDGKFVKGEMKGNVEVPAHGQARVDWAVHAAKAGKAQVTVTAQSKTLADAMTRSIPVIPHGIEKFVAQSLVLKGDSTEELSKEFTITIPKERIKESTSLRLSLSPSLAANLLDALPYLANYPYGCVEQTMSRFLPSVIVAKAIGDLGLTQMEVEGYISDVLEPRGDPQGHPDRTTDPTYSRVKEMSKDSLKRLFDFQHSDGGWGWWKTGDSDRFMSAYVVWGLSLASEAGLDVPSDVINRGVNFLQVQLVQEENESDMLAWMLHALAYAQSSSTFEDKQRERLWEMRDQLNPYTRALFALSEKKRGQEERAQALARNLANGIQEDKDNQTAHWGEAGINYRWSEGGVEATAFVIKALANIDPKSAYLEPAVKWMSLNRRGASWKNTRDTAIAILGLTDYLKASNELSPDYQYQIFVNGEAVRQGKVTEENALAFDRLIDLPADTLKDGVNTIKVTLKGKGSLYLSGYLKYFTLEEGITKAGNEIFVERKYYKQSTKETLMKGYANDWKPIKDGDTLQSGDRLRVDIVMEAKNHYEYLITEDYKPAGFEAVELKSGEGEAIVLDRKGHETNEKVSLYQEFRDQKAAFFIFKLKQGKYLIRYELRAEVPGQFHAMPNQAHAMYVPEIRANSDETRLNIED